MDDKPVKKETEKVELEHVSHKNIHAARSAFQGEMKAIERDGNVDFKKKNSDERVTFEYTTLGQTVEVINPLLGRHGLAFAHELSEKGIECVLTHETTEEKLEKVRETKLVKEQTEDIKSDYDIVVYGEIRSGVLPLDLTKADMKEVGAQITYGRRYTLGLVLGLATEEDKDAELFEQSTKNLGEFAFKQAKETIEKAKPETLEEQITFLEKELKLAQDLEAGTGTKAPSIGLKATQYQSLLTIAKARKGGKTAPKGGSGADEPAGGQGGNE